MMTGERNRMSNQEQDLTATIMTDSEFFRIGEFIQKQCGIKMSLSKKTMLQTRLSKRLHRLCLSSYSEYADFVIRNRGNGEELYHMIDAVTTNKTDFFREPNHFEFLSSSVLSSSPVSGGTTWTKTMKFWSAGCSTGEEPYTLAMVLAEHALAQPQFRFSILATDISTKVLHLAEQAVYLHDKIQPVPIPMRKKYLLSSKDRKLVRICPELRSRVSFFRLNFMDSDYALKDKMDVIFCRNVIIYFDRSTQQAILERLCRHLLPGGYLFMGHSETLNGMNLPLQPVAATIYRKSHENA
jgi:chemotaxis protein methyltransferase CheR